MEGPDASPFSRAFAQWRLIGILGLVHIALSTAMWAVAGLLIYRNQLGFPRDFLFFGVALGQLTLAATWAAYGTPRLIFRGLVSLLLVLVGGHDGIAAFCFTSGNSTFEYLTVLLMAGQWFLFVTALLVSIRWLLGRRIVHLSQPQDAAKEKPQFNLRQLLGLSAVWALPLAAPGLLSGQPDVAGSLLLSCAIISLLVLPVAALLANAALARDRLKRKLAWAFAVIILLSGLETTLFLGSMWSDMTGLVVSMATMFLWAIGSVAAFNGMIALVVLPTMLVMRCAGYRFAQRRRAVKSAASISISSAGSEGMAVRSAA